MSLENTADTPVVCWGGPHLSGCADTSRGLCSSFKENGDPHQAQTPGKLSSETKASVFLNGCVPSTLRIHVLENELGPHSP